MAEPESPVPRKERRARKRPLPLPEVKFVPAGNPSLPTFVSLMLMITTFMIVLTSISLHENTRMRQLMNSVRETFAGAEGNAAVGEEATRRALLGAAATGFQTAVPLATVDTAAGGDRLELTVPVDAALDTSANTARPELEKGLAALKNALDRRPGEFEYQIDIRFDDAALGNPHAAAIAAAALKGGIPTTRLAVSTGLVKADLDAGHMVGVLVELNAVQPIGTVPTGEPASKPEAN